MQNATTAGSSQSNVSRVYIWKDNIIIPGIFSKIYKKDQKNQNLAIFVSYYFLTKSLQSKNNSNDGKSLN